MVIRQNNNRTGITDTGILKVEGNWRDLTNCIFYEELKLGNSKEKKLICRSINKSPELISVCHMCVLRYQIS